MTFLGNHGGGFQFILSEEQANICDKKRKITMTDPSLIKDYTSPTGSIPLSCQKSSSPDSDFDLGGVTFFGHILNTGQLLHLLHIPQKHLVPSTAEPCRTAVASKSLIT